jgi:hypothetical protein
MICFSPPQNSILRALHTLDGRMLARALLGEWTTTDAYIRS